MAYLKVLFISAQEFVGETRNDHSMVTRKPKVKKLYGRPRHNGNDGIKMDPQVIQCKGVNIISSMKCFIDSENTTLPKMFIQYSVTKSVLSEMTSKKSYTSGRQEQKCTFISTILISVFSFIILPHNYVHTMFY